MQAKTDGDFCLSVDSAEQVWVLGTALEFGYCKATKKASSTALCCAALCCACCAALCDVLFDGQAAGGTACLARLLLAVRAVMP